MYEEDVAIFGKADIDYVPKRKCMTSPSATM